jgi:phthiocerol/phenolphthiocerol synthesis type-I polyketide synthase E
MDNTEVSDDDESPESIAIIGMAGRFPDANNIEEFWQNTQSGTESIQFFSDQELLDSGISQEQLDNPNYIKAKGALNNVDQFDAEFFAMSAREAEITDPQQRLLLECAWQAMEHAGYAPTEQTIPVGVYAGVSNMKTYLQQNLLPNEELRQTIGDFQLNLANSNDFVATRIAYKLNLTGSAMTIQTACSTSLVALIKGAALNNDGSEKVGFTAPSINAQAQVISEALELGSLLT